jgi:hypothetical protein
LAKAIPQWAIAHSGSSTTAFSKQLTASSKLKQYAHSRPRSNHTCACGEDVVTVRR